MLDFIHDIGDAADSDLLAGGFPHDGRTEKAFIRTAPAAEDKAPFRIFFHAERVRAEAILLDFLRRVGRKRQFIQIFRDERRQAG